MLDERQVVGGMRRENDRCPVCHGADRTRMMMLYLKAATELGARPFRILHVAPDHGLYLWLKRQSDIDYVCSDLDAARYRHIEGLQTADLTALPFDSNDFDIVICSHVLEHVPNDRAALAEICRVLKPGGHAILLAPFAGDGQPTDEDPGITDPAERDRRFGQWDHVRIYNPEDFLARMRESGMLVNRYSPFESHPEAARELYLNPRECLPIGRKPPVN